MEVQYGHEKEIHTRGTKTPQSEPLHAAGNPGQHLLHLAFKEAFWALSLQGYTGTAAFRKLGYNTEVLGLERIHNTTKRIRWAAKSPEGLCECTRGGVRLTGGTGLAAPADEAARRMKREILVLQQQMAFLKKVMKLHDGPEK